MKWNTPPQLKKSDDSYRQVGFELEFSGIDLDRFGQTIVSLYGGTLESESPFQHKVLETEFGDFTLEVDSIQLKDRKYKRLMEDLGVELDEHYLEKMDETLYDLAKIAVPFELVTPPIPINRISELSQLEDALYLMQAKGTRASFLYGFGMQFNPELPALDAKTILAHLRAFFLLQDWLKQEINVDITRRLLPFINDFPQAYIHNILQPDYNPSMGQLMDDYLQHNPTRNRPLDMTCLFAHIDKDRTFHAVEDPKLIKPRPTFHYRLPDCRIDEKTWSMALEWNRWVEVERLAANPKAIREMSQAYLAQSDLLSRWLDNVEGWLNNE